MSIIHTQLNAPILCAIAVDKIEAFREINESDYGTGLRIFTNNPKKYEKYLP
jgi:acyl-CoA reductase-like NAD-dependent aldehyde dehydrogenase